MIHDEIGLQAGQVEAITHKLSYLYQRATKAVSYCPPAYYADILCARGRAWLMKKVSMRGKTPGTKFDFADEDNNPKMNAHDKYGLLRGLPDIFASHIQYMLTVDQVSKYDVLHLSMNHCATGHLSRTHRLSVSKPSQDISLEYHVRLVRFRLFASKHTLEYAGTNHGLVPKEHIRRPRDCRSSPLENWNKTLGATGEGE